MEAHAEWYNLVLSVIIMDGNAITCDETTIKERLGAQLPHEVE